MALRHITLLGPLLLLLGAAYVLPFLGVMEWSVTLPEPGLGQYRTALTDPLILGVIWRTIRICAAVTILSVAAGYVLTLIWVRGGPVDLRLEQVRTKLVRGDIHTSVTTAAMACGFKQLGWFANQYKEKYGETPSETLRRGTSERVFL